ncbi:MAG: dihydrodipicolinate synthase family protein [Chloroflexi bacterium]|nr:dihydrodipicolinate synthase family protein [Chloroflexota bacterium]
MATWAGVYAILATPFDEAGQLDEVSLCSLVDFELACGVQGLTILGQMGEYHKLADAERERVTEIVMRRVAGRVPVIVGVSHTGTDVVIQLAQSARRAGAAGIMVSPPSGVRGEAALLAHFRRVAATVDVPLIVQDEPVMTGVIMPPALLARLARDISTLTAIKLEEPPSPSKLSQVLALTEGRVAVFGGLGGLFFLEELGRGARGAMTGYAFPEALVEIYSAHITGDHDRAARVFHQHLPLIRFEAQVGIGLGIRKEILRRRGAMRTAIVREPAPAIDADTWRELDDLLRQLDLMPPGAS